MRTLIKQELSGWKAWEIAWMSIACAIIIGLSLYWGDTLMGIISATTGVACVVATGKGKLMAYVFGLVNCVLYAIIAYQAKYYGEVSLNVLYYVPMQFVGWFVWVKHMNKETGEVNKRHMSWKLRALSFLGIICGTVGYGFVLKAMGGNLPFVDAFTTVCSVIAMIVSVGMYAEQWYIWIVVNIFSVGMYIVDVMNGGNSYATILMWSTYLINAIIMCIKWEKEARQNKEVMK